MTTQVIQLPGTIGQTLDNDVEGRRFEELQSLLPIERPAAPPRPEIPEVVLLGFLRDGRLKVESPITVQPSEEGKQVIVEAKEFNEFGFGNNLSEAITDLQHAIVELYFTLERDQSRLGTDLRELWARLQRKVIPRK